MLGIGELLPLTFYTAAGPQPSPHGAPVLQSRSAASEASRTPAAFPGGLAPRTRDGPKGNCISRGAGTGIGGTS